MESKKGRVLAYSMAQVINKEDLSEVSGGSQMTHQKTLQPSGGDGFRSMDPVLDVVLDW